MNGEAPGLARNREQLPPLSLKDKWSSRSTIAVAVREIAHKTCGLGQRPQLVKNI